MKENKELTPNKVLKSGDVVKVIGDTHTGKLIHLSCRHTILSKYKLIGMIESEDVKGLVYIRFILLDGSGQTERFHVNDLEKIPPEKYYEWQRDAIREAMKSIGEEARVIVDSMNKFIETPKTPFSELNFKEPLTVIYCHDGFFTTGVKMTDDTIIEYKHYYRDNCLSTIKKEIDNGHYSVYIPVDWVNAAGYTEEYVKRWIDIINTFDFEVPLTYKGIVEYKNHANYSPYENIRMKLATGNKVEPYNKLERDSAQSLLLNNLYYKVILEGCESGIINLYVYRLLTALFTFNASHLPGLTMQILDNVQGVYPFEAFLMALLKDKGRTFVGFNTFYDPNTTASLDGHGKPLLIKKDPKLPSITPVVNPFLSENCARLLCKRMEKIGMVKYDLLDVKEEDFKMLSTLVENKEFNNYYKFFKKLNDEKTVNQ